MKYWQITAPNVIKLLERDDYSVGEQCAKIKLTKVGVSSPDIRSFAGSGRVSYPVVPCRQAVGIVLEDGTGSFSRGQRVVVEPYSSCGICTSCKSGRHCLCEKLVTNGFNDEGFLKDFAVVPVSSLHALPDHVRDNDAVFLDYIALAINVISTLSISKGDYIAIIGGGITGTIIAKVAMYYQAVPIVIDASAERLDAAQNTDIYYTVCSADINVVKKVRNLTGGRMCEHAVYMFSSGQPMSMPFELTAHGGHSAFLGWDMDELAKADPVDLTPVIKKHLTFSAINNGHKLGASAINMLANKVIDISAFPQREIPFAEAGAFFESLNGNYLVEKCIIKI